MTHSSRKTSGLKAKRNGQAFENIVEFNCERDKWALIRIPDGCRSLGYKNLIRVKSPFDYCIAKSGKVLFFDAKTTLTNTWSYSMTNFKQVDELMKLEAAWQIAGYLVRFEKANKVVFFIASQLRNLKPREGLQRAQGIELGTNMDFDISKALEFNPKGLVELLNPYIHNLSEVIEKL